MRLRALTLLTLAFTTAAGCAMPYGQSYRRTNNAVQPKPVAAQSVKVVRNRADLGGTVTDLGLYKGRAPTVAEAMDAAKATCGREGAEFFVLNTDPYLSGSVYIVDGVCATR